MWECRRIGAAGQRERYGAPPYRLRARRYLVATTCQPYRAPHPECEDDPRYAQLRQDWGRRYHSQLFLFLQIQAAAALVLVTAVAAEANNPAPLGWGDAIGIIIAVVAIIGESLSDAQLAAFKTKPENRGKICDAGLWSLSRHPNYFFEWLYWLAYIPIGLGFAGYPWGWASMLAPLLMYWLLVHVSGVPPLEAHMLRTRGKAFQSYQRRVRAFWPVPRT